MILDIFAVTVAVTSIALLIVATVMTVLYDENPDHVYDDEL